MSRLDALSYELMCSRVNDGIFDGAFQYLPDTERDTLSNESVRGGSITVQPIRVKNPNIPL